MSQINIMALRHSAFYSPLLMTMAGGFLREEGLEAKYQVQTPDNTVADNIHNGRCQVAQSAVATSFEILKQDGTIEAIHFAQINERDGFFIAGREPEPEFSWSNLLGKKVLVDHFFQPHAMFKYGLHRQGIDINDLLVVDAGEPDEMEQAFRQGKGDYIHLQGPAPQQLEYDGAGYVVAAVGDAVGPVAFSSLCAQPDWLETAEASAFMRAYRAAREYVIVESAEDIAAKELEAGFFPGIERQVLVDTLSTYKSLGCWAPACEISVESYECLLGVFLHSGLIDQRYAYETVITNPPK